MRIELLFQFKDELRPLAVSGVEGDVTDLLLPSPGDLISHVDMDGQTFSGTVAKRAFAYALPDGKDIDGTVTVTLFMHHIPVQ